MTTKKDDQGRPRAETEVEIHATPEAVWEAIATGPGIKSWFMGMENEFGEREGGEVRTEMGDKMVPIFTEDDTWDTQVGDTSAGWPAFFHVLRNYVERHAEMPSGVVHAMGPVLGSKEEAFERLVAALGIGPIGGNMTAIATMYYYGEGAAEAGAAGSAKLTAWLQAHGQAAVSWPP